MRENLSSITQALAQETYCTYYTNKMDLCLDLCKDTQPALILLSLYTENAKQALTLFYQISTEAEIPLMLFGKNKEPASLFVEFEKHHNAIYFQFSDTIERIMNRISEILYSNDKNLERPLETSASTQLFSLPLLTTEPLSAPNQQTIDNNITHMTHASDVLLHALEQQSASEINAQQKQSDFTSELLAKYETLTKDVSQMKIANIQEQRAAQDRYHFLTEQLIKHSQQLEHLIQTSTPKFTTSTSSMTAIQPTSKDQDGSIEGPNSIVELFTTLWRQQITGRIDFFYKVQHKTLFFEKGIPTEVYSNDRNDLFEAYLYRTGILDETLYRKIRSQGHRSAHDSSIYLIKTNHLTEKQLNPLLRAHLKHVVFTLFTWQSGSYQFHSVDLKDTIKISLNQDPRSIILEGIKKSYHLKRMKNILGNPTSLISPISNETIPTNLLPLTPDDIKFIQTLTNTKSIEELTSAIQIPLLNAYQLCTFLVTLGYAQVHTPLFIECSEHLKIRSQHMNNPSRQLTPFHSSRTNTYTPPPPPNDYLPLQDSFSRKTYQEQ